MTTAIETAWREGRIIRGKWSDTDTQGRQLLCLYTALAGDPEARPGTCPASLCPRWLAELLPSFDDKTSLEAWPSIVERVVRLAPHLGSLTPAQSNAAQKSPMIAVLRIALRSAPSQAAVIERVIALCLLSQAGNEPSVEEWRAAAWAAWAEAARAALEAAVLFPDGAHA